MKRFLITAAIAVISLTTVTSAADVGLSLSVGQPGFYGQLNIGDFPQPRIIYAQPMIIDRRMQVSREPIYLRVPPHQIKHWKKNCHRYNACNQRVLFVNDGWYRNEYAPRYREKHYDQRDYRDDRRDERRDDHHDNGHKDKGHGRDH